MFSSFWRKCVRIAWNIGLTLAPFLVVATIISFPYITLILAGALALGIPHKQGILNRIMTISIIVGIILVFICLLIPFPDTADWLASRIIFLIPALFVSNGAAYYRAKAKAIRGS